MRIKTEVIIITILTTLLPLISQGQKGSFHPFTRYGLGEIATEGFTENTAMGGVSAGIHLKNKINYMNPASYVAQDTNSFVFDIGLNTRKSQFSTSQQSTQKNTTAFDHFAIGFPVTSKWKSSIGIVPFSKTGYNIKSSFENELGGRSYFYDGSGGVNRFYIGNAFELTEYLSVGLNYFYMFGSLNHNLTIQWDNDSTMLSRNLRSEKTRNVSASAFNLGMQFTPNLFKKYDLTIGATYELSPGFNLEDETFQSNGLDTITSAESYSADYPNRFSAGLSLENEKFIYGLDFNYTNWSNLSNSLDNITDSYSFRTGFQYTPDKEALKSYFKKISYRFGAYYKEGYYQFENNNIEDYGITFGLGLPLQYQKTNFNLSLQLGRKGTTNNGLIEEEYAIVNFSITFHDFWFIKHKYQ